MLHTTYLKKMQGLQQDSGGRGVENGNYRPQYIYKYKSVNY